MERRNHYRILHVQPDAPAEIIRASYRSLMLKLRHHPDRGGSHQAAVTLNCAYRTLSDPDRRRAYDRTLSTAQRAPWPRSLTAGIPARPPESDTPRAGMTPMAFRRASAASVRRRNRRGSPGTAAAPAVAGR
jgi:DnaJ-class molecular chaperone